MRRIRTYTTLIPLLVLIPWTGCGGKGTSPTAPKPTTGSLAITSIPSGAWIFLDGDSTAYQTPSTINNVSPGTHAVRLVPPPPYVAWQQSVSVTAGATTNVDAKVYVADNNSGHLVCLTASGSLIRVISPDFGANNVRVCRRWSGTLNWVYVTGNNALAVYDADGILISIVGNGTPGPGIGQFSFVGASVGMAIDDNGFVYVNDAGNHRILKLDGRGGYLATVGTSSGEGPLAIDPSGQLRVYNTIDSTGGAYVAVWNLSGHGAVCRYLNATSGVQDVWLDRSFHQANDASADNAGNVTLVGPVQYTYGDPVGRLRRLVRATSSSQRPIQRR